MKLEKVKIGTRVIYYPFKRDDGSLFGTPYNTVIISEPWQLGTGDPVCKIEGKSGGILISHLVSFTSKFSKGDTVVMHSCIEAKDPECKGKVWTCKTDSFISRSGSEVVFLEEYSGYFLVEYLQVIC
jgi:hypothetical protein